MFLTISTDTTMTIIANPIYDLVFKNLMENNRIAKFIISTILKESIESLVVSPQEFTYENKNVPTFLSLYRLDFVATIKLSTGREKKVLIEVQKAGDRADFFRFRNYVGDQYKRKETINNVEVILPIITIYILGFNLPYLPYPYVRIERIGKDSDDNIINIAGDEFINLLTHDSCIIQTKRVIGKDKTSLDKVLNCFEQKYFVNDTTITKEYDYPTDLKEIQEIYFAIVL